MAAPRTVMRGPPFHFYRSMRLWRPEGASILSPMHGKKEFLLFALLLGFFVATGAACETGMIPVEPGVDLFYRKIGSGPETLVVILHAESLVDDLAPLTEGRTVIFYSPRGRGRSSRIDASKISFENEFKDLEAVRGTSSWRRWPCSAGRITG